MRRQLWLLCGLLLVAACTPQTPPAGVTLVFEIQIPCDGTSVDLYTLPAQSLGSRQRITQRYTIPSMATQVRVTDLPQGGYMTYHPLEDGQEFWTRQYNSYDHRYSLRRLYPADCNGEEPGLGSATWKGSLYWEP